MASDPRLAALPALRQMADTMANDWHTLAYDMGRGAAKYYGPERVAAVFLAQLSDLTIAASRDAVARMVAEAVGLTRGATAPAFYWTAEAHDLTDNDGAPNGDGWPAGWWLSDNVGNLVFFTAADWCPGDFTMIADLPDGEGNAVRAFTLIALAVLGVPDAP